MSLSRIAEVLARLEQRYDFNYQACEADLEWACAEIERLLVYIAGVVIEEQRGSRAAYIARLEAELKKEKLKAYDRPDCANVDAFSRVIAEMAKLKEGSES